MTRDPRDDRPPEEAPRRVRLADLEAVSPRTGVTRRRLIGTGLELIHYHYDPGTTFPKHAHAAEQITVVQRGVLVFTFPDGSMRLGAGEAVLIPSGVPHGAHVPNGADGPTETLNLFTPVRVELPE